MSKKYRKRDSGLLVPQEGIELPWYARRERRWPPEEKRWMSRRRCCCGTCNCSGTPISADGTVEWFSHTVASGVITRVDHEGACKTYWVDSVSGGGAESGSGTEADPWTNLNTVFSNNCIYAICTSAAAPDLCPRVKVLVKGTIDYVVAGNAARNYLLRLIIEPWGAGPIAITLVSPSGTVHAVRYCIGCVFKHFDFSVTSDGTVSGWDADCFADCSGSAFDACVGVVSGSVNNFSSATNRVFSACSSSAFDDCSGTVTSDVIESPVAEDYSWAFYNCAGSTFRGCAGTGIANNQPGDGGDYGTAIGLGFTDCSSSIFDTCTGTGTATYVGTGNGFVTYQGFGFLGNASSTFRNCDGNGGVTVGIGGSYGMACGFDDNTGSSFSGCTTTAPVCINRGCDPCDI